MFDLIAIHYRECGLLTSHLAVLQHSGYGDDGVRLVGASERGRNVYWLLEVVYQCGARCDVQ